MRIAIVVHGRFYAFDLARALMDRGHDVALLTNYPKWAVKRFGISPDRVRSFWLHGLLCRIIDKLHISLDFLLHPLFGAWAERQLRREAWDIIHPLTGVAEEILLSKPLANTVTVLGRGSAHIRTQATILREEQQRANCPIDQPGAWIIAREEREYALATRIMVLSTFAYNSFLAEGVPSDRLRMVPLGTDLSAFRATESVIAERQDRILSGKPLRVLFVGSLSFQKGLVDLQALVERTAQRYHFRFVGPVPPEARQTISMLEGKAEFVPKRPQRELPNEYAWGDVMLFPTLQDGFAVVLAQAMAAALPILTTPNCSGRDLVSDGVTGWILPVRSPEAFARQLEWCDSHRQELSNMVMTAGRNYAQRDWSAVAADFEALCCEALEVNRSAKLLQGTNV